MIWLDFTERSHQKTTFGINKYWALSKLWNSTLVEGTDISGDRQKTDQKTGIPEINWESETYSFLKQMQYLINTLLCPRDQY